MSSEYVVGEDGLGYMHLSAGIGHYCVTAATEQQDLEAQLVEYAQVLCDRAEGIHNGLKAPTVDDAMHALSILINFDELDSQNAHQARFAALAVLAKAQTCDFFHLVNNQMQDDANRARVKVSVAKFSAKAGDTLHRNKNGIEGILQAIGQLVNTIIAFNP